MASFVCILYARSLVDTHAIRGRAIIFRLLSAMRNSCDVRADACVPMTINDKIWFCWRLFEITTHYSFISLDRPLHHFRHRQSYVRVCVHLNKMFLAWIYTSASVRWSVRVVYFRLLEQYIWCRHHPHPAGGVNWKWWDDTIEATQWNESATHCVVI